MGILGCVRRLCVPKKSQFGALGTKTLQSTAFPYAGGIVLDIATQLRFYHWREYWVVYVVFVAGHPTTKCLLGVTGWQFGATKTTQMTQYSHQWYKRRWIAVSRIVLDIAIQRRFYRW